MVDKTFKWTDIWSSGLNSIHDMIFFSRYIEKYGYRYDPLSNDPDLLLCSVFGNDRDNFNCPKILWSGENFRRWYGTLTPNLSADWIFTTNEPLSKNEYYLPYFVIEYDITRDLHKIRDKKSKFCAFIYGNDSNIDEGVLFRNKLFNKLNDYRKVDSAGTVFNNMSGWKVPRDINVYDKWISDYKFVICIENTFNKGYCTEKIGRALCHGAVPIYYGDPDINYKFNKNCMISNDNIDLLVNQIIHLDQNYHEYQSILYSDKLNTSVDESVLNRNNTLKIIDKILEELS